MEYVDGPQTPSYKVIMLGNSTVGKTSILTQLHFNKFEADPKATVGGTFTEKVIDTANGPVKLQLWDTAGQEQFRCLVPIYSRGASAAIIVLDVTSQKSFDAFDEWYELVNRDANQQCLLFVAANKNDLEPVVKLADVEEWANKHKAKTFSTSAKDEKSINDLFECVATTLSNVNAATFENIGDQKLKKENKGGCCG